MKNKIKSIVKLPDSSVYGQNRTNFYHVYLNEPGFNSEPKGVMVEEKVTDNGTFYNVKPLGLIASQNIFFASPVLYNKQNEAKEFFDWFTTLDQSEIRNIVHGRELLKG